MQSLLARQHRVGAVSVGPRRTQACPPRVAARKPLLQPARLERIRCRYTWGRQDPKPQQSSNVRQAIIEQLAKATSWQDMRRLVVTFNDYMLPEDYLQIMSAVQAPAIASKLPPQPPQQPPTTSGYPTAQQAWHALAGRKAAGGYADYTQPVEDDTAVYRDLMSQLAWGYQKVLPQASADNIVAMTRALTNAGALNQGLAEDILHHAGKLAAASQLSMQNLADVMLTLGKAKLQMSPTLLQQVVWDVDPLNRCDSLQDLAGLLEGLSKLGYQPSQAFVDSVMDRMAQRQAENAKKQEQEQQLAKEQPHEHRSLLSALWGSSKHDKKNGKDAKDSNAGWGGAQAGGVPPPQPQQPTAPPAAADDQPRFGPLFSGIIRDVEEQRRADDEKLNMARDMWRDFKNANSASKETAKLSEQARRGADAVSEQRPGVWPVEEKKPKTTWHGAASEKQQVQQPPVPQPPPGGWETDAEAELREQQEAAQVAATVRSLERMGHRRQAEQLKSTYLQDLQKRVADRARARIYQHQQQAAEQQAQLEAQARAEADRYKGYF